ncbi:MULTISPECIES: enoyl-CoA hydratase-related protein [unclassified Bradyrhizobium]|uniref:enoyl-CoA hydratase-related protein n=1 Tax=unclassified Bradyrhizobium TaxID=2631580 RepID=UPI001FFB986C|nr:MULTISPECIES: enoyl-CoA hydratase-related protein [unclassified Bradyrhizobium]MCK1522855.1 enoyl-CoA hydratase/isomerase family protein [Bradyrhizobium sp. 17]MCK1686666.1 enoyl-CoA hydratase/isomerase family protein [Bradyrhizobium sp. 145]
MAIGAQLKQFRIEMSTNGVLHLIFDMPDRSMNVFSNAAIDEVGLFADWLKQSEVIGVVISSGKPTAFCAGADLAELETAYDMIMAAPSAERDRLAFDHFFRLSHGLRRLETAGKPVAVAVAGLALGGGCEFALAAHHRVIADRPQATFGLPESLVGLLPGGGGTQRLPRLIGIEAALPVLLDGARIGGQAALAAGLADELVGPGEEMAAAERWVLSQPAAKQPWDRPDWHAADTSRVAAIIGASRRKMLAETLGHYPAPSAILDCVEQGLSQDFDCAIRTEMQIFAKLIQRREPRNMIRTLFLGRLDYERLKKKGMNPQITEAVAAISKVLGAHSERGKELSDAFARAGFRGEQPRRADFDGRIADAVYWHDDEPRTWGKDLLRARLADAEAAAADWRTRLDETERRAADYVLVTQAGFPAYLGGLFAAGLN